VSLTRIRKPLQLAALTVSMMVWASAARAFNPLPTWAFAQVGVGDQKTLAYVAGVRWDAPWQWRTRYGTLTGYFEAGFGRWATESRPLHSAAWPTQISLTPVLRLQRDPSSPWFGELGVGVNYIVPIFHSGTKRFSTEFNFGDHIAVGRRFGAQQRYELALRFEHFSNAGIAHPNPGENFGQLRISVHF
jgi:hypothetical protein